MACGQPDRHVFMFDQLFPWEYVAPLPDVSEHLVQLQNQQAAAEFFFAGQAEEGADIRYYRAYLLALEKAEHGRQLAGAMLCAAVGGRVAQAAGPWRGQSGR
ncbi:unnamed protein product [Prorocentrum cordatum]|uniref:Uncharacterized protein n=1 Tax=Prorocentrum cordatum TaxID=2364126 RepID=A0ABN9Y678_9DINO|nr:unnamed protein product [Polarella glacialis]